MRGGTCQDWLGARLHLRDVSENEQAFRWDWFLLHWKSTKFPDSRCFWIFLWNFVANQYKNYAAERDQAVQFPLNQLLDCCPKIQYQSTVWLFYHSVVFLASSDPKFVQAWSHDAPLRTSNCTSCKKHFWNSSSVAAFSVSSVNRKPNHRWGQALRLCPTPVVFRLKNFLGFSNWLPRQQIHHLDP